MPAAMSARPARERILRGDAPEGLIVHGALEFVQTDRLTALPDGLEVDTLRLDGCTELRALPAGLRCRRLNVTLSQLHELPADLVVMDELILWDWAQLTALPNGLRLQKLVAVRCTALAELPADLQVTGRLDVPGCANLRRLPDGLQTEWIQADNCVRLEELPAGLTVQTLSVAGCASLRALPDRLEAETLDISDCVLVDRWPTHGLRTLRRLSMRNCWRMCALPPMIRTLEELDISGCTGLRELPERLRITSRLEVADTSLERIPPSASGRLHWRGVRIPDWIALRPETITTSAVLNQWNAEVRRVMIERIGYERFMFEAGAEILDDDFDPGGPRQLLRVTFGNDEPLVCLAVYDPSTGRQYLLRVPPAMRSCRQAAAWIAGFDNPDVYRPTAET